MKGPKRSALSKMIQEGSGNVCFIYQEFGLGLTMTLMASFLRCLGRLRGSHSIPQKSCHKWSLVGNRYSARYPFLASSCLSSFPVVQNLPSSLAVYTVVSLYHRLKHVASTPSKQHMATRGGSMVAFAGCMTVYDGMISTQGDELGLPLPKPNRGQQESRA